MEPVLIYIDQPFITKEIRIINKSVTFYQSIYNALIAIGIDATLQEISHLVQWKTQAHQSRAIENFAREKLFEKAGSYTFNGVALNPDMLRQMIVVPDLTPLNNVLAGYHSIYEEGVNGTDISLLTLTGGVIAKKNDTDTVLNAKYTFYTKTDASAAFANTLLTVIDALNQADEDQNGYFTGKKKDHVPFGITTFTNYVNPGPYFLSKNDIRAFESGN